MNFPRFASLLALAIALILPSQHCLAQTNPERVQELMGKIRSRPDEALPDLCRAANWVKEDMAPALVEAAKDESWPQRSRALRVLVELGQFQEIPQFLKNPCPELRLAALDGLQRAPSETLEVAMSAIIELYQDSLAAATPVSESTSLQRQRAASALLCSSQATHWILLWRHEPQLHEAIRQLFQSQPTRAAAAILEDCRGAESPDPELLLEFSRLAASVQLMAALDEPSRHLQRAALDGLAARALPLAPGQPLPRAISQALKADDPELRAAAILAHFRLTASIEAAREGLRDPDVRVRRAALGSLLLSGPASATMREIIASFLDSDDLDSALRAAACFITLDGSCPDKAIPALARGLQRELEIRRTSLATINLAPSLCHHFRSELRKNLDHEEAPIRALAAQALLQLPELSGAELSTLSDTLERESDRHCRATLLPLVLRLNKDRGAELLLQQGLNQSDLDLQILSCSLAVGLAGFRLLEGRVLELSTDLRPELRTQALAALASAESLGVPALRRLLAALAEPEPEARKLAAHGLGRLGLPLAESIIERACQGDKAEKSAALLTLSRLEIGVDVVIATSHEKDIGLRSIACFALGAYSDPSARDRLKSLASSDPEATIRELAKKILVKEVPSAPARNP